MYWLLFVIVAEKPPGREGAEISESHPALGGVTHPLGG